MVTATVLDPTTDGAGCRQGVHFTLLSRSPPDAVRLPEGYSLGESLHYIGPDLTIGGKIWRPVFGLKLAHVLTVKRITLHFYCS